MEYNIFNVHVRKELKLIIKETIQECLSVNNEEKEFPQDLLSQTEAAKFLHVSVPTLIDRRKKGLIPFYQSKEKAPVFYKKSDLVALFSNENEK